MLIITIQSGACEPSIEHCPSKHSIAVCSRFRNSLNDVPMLDDFPIFQSKYIDNSGSPALELHVNG
jgi:hypothetical protein